MLFRLRVSLQGALHLRRRACDEMAAYHYTQSQGQSLEKASSSFTAPQIETNPARPLAFSPAHHPLRTKDCRWKRGRPVMLSGRTFSTEQTYLRPHECAVAERPPTAGKVERAPEQEEAMARLHQPHQHSKESGNIMACERKDTDSRELISTSGQLTPVPKDCVLRHAAPDSSEADSTSTPLADTHDTGRTPQPTTRAIREAAEEKYSPTSSEGDSRPETDGSETDDNAKEVTETHTSLTFQIPEDALRTAMAAPENTKASFWSSNLYRGPDNERILVHYCKTKEVAERVAQHFVNEKVLGFDVEWKPWTTPVSIKKNVSLIQLACENRIALFHIALFSGQTATQLMPPTLKALLESPEVYKVGVAVKGDFSRVAKFLDIKPQGVFELSRLHNLVEYAATDPIKVTNKLVGLAVQVQRHLQLPLYKGGQFVDDPDDSSNVRSSDWSLTLNLQQIHYAAADAYAGFRLYDTLEEKRKKLRPIPPRPLLCDYDSKPKPKTNDSNPRKKRSTATKMTRAPTVTAEAASESVEQAMGEKEIEGESSQSQDTEGYETAQEDLLDSHQLEGEDTVSSNQSYESTDQSEDDVSVETTPSLQLGKKASSPAMNQRRVGRVSLNWLKGPDPAYPILPEFSDDESAGASSNEDLVDISQDQKEIRPLQNVQPGVGSEADDETDEFDDSELEEALQNLDADSSGRLRDAGAAAVKSVSLIEASEKRSTAMDTKVEDNYLNVAVPPNPPVQDPHQDKEEQALIDLLNDAAVIADLQSPTHHPSSTSSPVLSTSTDPRTTSHTPEYTLATTWAQTYLTSTIPSPTSRAPSHIRATIPHLRAYHMWRHQGLPLDEISRHLRDPPLAASTVGNYVLQAISLERMEYDTEAVKEVLMGMPSALRRGKWRGLAEKVGAKRG